MRAMANQARGAGFDLARVAEDIEAFAKGGLDLELTHLDYADELGLDAGVIAGLWRQAKAARRVVAPPKPVVVPLKPAPAKASVAPKPTPVPAPKPATKGDPGRPVLNPNAPYDIAGEYIHQHCMHGEDCILWYWQGQFYRWSDRIYEVVPDESMRGQMYGFLNGAVKRSGGNLVPFEPDSRRVNEVIDALKSRLALGVECQPPMWIGDRLPAAEWVVFQNAVVNVLTEEVRPLTPDLWTHSALEFEWDPEAECPQWMEFLGQVFPGPDMESVNLLEEWMGYCMTEETKFQKGLLMIGQRRSGKGTISRVLQQLVGNRNYVGLSFNTWIYSENSKEVLIGKRVGVFADVRFKPGKTYGQNYDPGGVTHQSAEFLLNITGEDTVTIGRKYRAPWQGQLRLKLMAISNEVPNLNDSSGVLPSRFLKLHFPVSFYGREDIDLQVKLRTELSGIAVRCVQAYKDLCQRRGFIQPKSAGVLEQEVLEASDPFAAMVGACFVADLESLVTASALTETAKAYLCAIGRPDEAARVRDNNIIARVRGVAGFENVAKAPREHGKTRKYSGIRLRPRKEWKESLE